MKHYTEENTLCRNLIKTITSQVAVFCIVTPCGDVVGYQRFGRPCCLHRHDP